MSNPQKTILGFLWLVVKPYKWWYLLMLQAPFANAVFPLLYNYAIKLLIDMFTLHSHSSTADALYPAILFISSNAYLEICWRIHNFAAWRSMPYIMQNVMNEAYDYVANHSYAFFQNTLTGTITSKVKGINDGVQEIHNALEFQASKPVLTSLVSGIGLACMNWKIFSIVLIFSLVQGAVAIIFGKQLNAIETNKEQAWHGIVGYIADTFANIFTVFSFAKQQDEAQQVNAQYENNYKPQALRWHKIDFVMSCLQASIYFSFMAVLFIYIIHLKNIDEISTGDIVFVLGTTYVFVDMMWASINALKDFSHTVARFKSAFSIMQIPQEILDTNTAESLTVSGGEIVFRNVSFHYADTASVFQHFNLQIAGGQKIGIVGHSGAGKSTLIALLLKHFRLTAGDILIDEQKLYAVSSESLRSQIALIPQDIALFHRTIAENIGYAKSNATQAEIEAAAQAARIHEFIIKLPDKYQTLVGERGVKLSGGQRQRIAIARAILKNAPIWVLDEATSSLDSQTEVEIQHAINAILENNPATVIVIAHRLSTIKHLDRIIVMSAGQIVEDGTFQQLLAKTDGHFLAMWSSQVNGMIG